MRITMIGHSTVLVEAEGTRILTDPYFGTWGNPAYKRLSPPAMRREDVGPLDLVLLSHNHFDHKDRRFLSGLPEDTPVIAPAPVRWVTKLNGARNVQGMRAWAEKQVGPVRITAVPALHMAVTLGFVLEVEEKRIYFAGDTFYRPFMAEIGKRFRLDVALMPVTTYRIPMTMGEKGACRAAEDLRAKTIIPIHLGIQPRSPLLRTSQTPEGFRRRIQEAGLDSSVVILREGDQWTPPDFEST